MRRAVSVAYRAVKALGLLDCARLSAGARNLVVLCVLSLLYSLAVPVTAAAAVAYVQGGYNAPGTTVTTLSVAYTKAQNAGDLNVVSVAWGGNSTPTVKSVTDSMGNVYVAATGITASSGNESDQTFYAKNIASATAGGNTVTVTFSSSVIYPELRVAEYSGMDTVAPLDAWVGATGTGLTQNSGTLTTTYANDLLVATNGLGSVTTAAGTGYTLRMTTGEGEILEDEVVTATGSYSAGSTQQSSGYWLMQLVAFRAASTITAPTGLSTSGVSANQISLSWTAATDSAGVSGYLIERCSGASCASFVQVAEVTSGTAYSDINLTASTSYSYRIRATDSGSNLGPYSSVVSVSTPAETAPTGAESVTYTYDAVGRLKKTLYADGTTVNYTLDAAGNRKQVSGGPAAPGAPGVPVVTGITTTTATVSWTAASGNVTSYEYSLNSGAWTNVGTALTVNLSGLNSGTTYTVQVHAVNNGSAGTASSASFSTLLGAPGVPTFTNLTATAATATWTAASGTVTSYQYSVNSGAWSSVGTALTVNLTGLTPVTAYTVQVRAVNASGAGAASSASVTTLPGTPGVPSFTAITATTATVSWTAAPGTVTSYVYSVNSGTGTSVGTALTVNLSGLTPATAYTVRVRAVNNGIAGAASSWSFTTLPGAPGAPSFTNLTSTAATVSWTAASGNITQYQYSVNSGAWTSAGTGLTVNLTGLSPVTAYSVQVRAVDVTGAGAASSGSFTTLTPIPSAPGTPSFSNITATTATVTWTAPSGSVTSYEYAVNAGAWINTGTTLTANLSGLTSATSYTVEVHAINAGGTGPVSSATFSTLTVAGAPGTPSFSNITATTATVSWTAATGGVTSYAYSVNGAAWTNVGTALTANLTGLTAGTNYPVQVEAINAGGSGPASTGTLLTLPGAPGTPSTTNITTTTATATWTAPPGITTSYDYRLEYSLDAGQTWTSVGTAVTVVLTGLTPGTTYTVQVHAVNSSGAGAATADTFTTEPPSPGTPTFTNITPTTATVSWTAASGIVASYQYSVNSGAWTNVGTALTVNLSGLAQLTNYTVQVQAVNVSGAGPASSAAFTTLPSLPGPPGTPSFSNITPTSATVVWTGASGTVASYQYSLNSGGWVNVGMALTVNLSGLTPGSNNTVQVQAVNVTGPSTATSNGFTTPPSIPGSPGAPSFSSITGTTATASWGAASGTVASYQYSVNSGAWVNVGTVLTVNLTGLAAGTGYTVQVEAVNVTGAGTASSAAFTTMAPPSSPGTPSFSAITANSATVSWSAASGTVASYQYSVNSGAWVNVGTALSVNLSGLAAVTSYTVQVEALNASFTGAASSASFTTLPVTETATVTPELVKESSNLTMVGYSSGVGGSISPVKLSNNVLSYVAFCDIHYTPSSSHLQISGFTSDPGASWLVSAEAYGVTQLGSAASYAYASGTASWAWTTTFGFVATGTVAVQVAHH